MWRRLRSSWSSYKYRFVPWQIVNFKKEAIKQKTRSPREKPLLHSEVSKLKNNKRKTRMICFIVIFN